EGADHLLPREPKELGEKLGEALAADGIELCFGQHASGVSRDGDEYVLEFPERDPLRGDRLLVATGRRPRVRDIGLDKVGIEPGKAGIEVDGRMNAGEGIWAIGDVAGIWPLTYVGKYQGRVAAANILGRRWEANYDAVPRVAFTHPQERGGRRERRDARERRGGRQRGDRMRRLRGLRGLHRLRRPARGQRKAPAAAAVALSRAGLAALFVTLAAAGSACGAREPAAP